MTFDAEENDVLELDEASNDDDFESNDDLLVEPDEEDYDTDDAEDYAEESEDEEEEGEDFEDASDYFQDDDDDDSDSDEDETGSGNEDGSDEVDENEAKDDKPETPAPNEKIDPANPAHFVSHFKDEQDALANGIKPEYVPGNKEFIAAAKEDAIAKVEEEFGEFDSFDTDHLAAFNAYNIDAMRKREDSYESAVEHIKTGFQKKQQAEQEKAAVEKLDNEMNQILSTPGLKQRFQKALKKISVGAYEEIVDSLNKGDTKKLTGFARKIAGVQAPQPERSNKKNVRKANKGNKAEIVGSDILGF